jgi:hypothetical protein
VCGAKKQMPKKVTGKRSKQTHNCNNYICV